MVAEDACNNEEKLVEILKKINEIDIYYVDGEACDLPKIIGFEIDGLGLVNFPLLEDDVKKLEKNGSARRVDNSTGLTFQLDPSQVKIKNPSWNVKLNDLVKRMGDTLGCQEEIEVCCFIL